MLHHSHQEDVSPKNLFAQFNCITSFTCCYLKSIIKTEQYPPGSEILSQFSLLLFRSCMTTLTVFFVLPLVGLHFLKENGPKLNNFSQDFTNAKWRRSLPSQVLQMMLLHTSVWFYMCAVHYAKVENTAFALTELRSALFQSISPTS